jgi:pSer/pThr/pTyr-binding forkhead associated (FHA) protein
MIEEQLFFIEILSIDGANQKIELINKETTIGRHSSCTIQIGVNNLHVSNRHASILIDNTHVTIEDLGSTNHLYVNGERITKIELRQGDTVRFGSQGPQFRLIIENKKLSIEPIQQSSNKNDSPDENSNLVMITVPKSQPDILNDNSLFDVSPDTENQQLSSEDRLLSSNVKISDTSNRVIPENVSDISDDDKNIFDISPSIKKQTPDLVPSSKQSTKKSDTKQETGPNSKHESIADDRLFDVSPDEDNVNPIRPVSTSNTMEISSRLQQQIMSTQDIDTLVKNRSTRNKIFADKNIGDQQKRIISSVINAYSSMKRRYFIVFGLIIVLLCFVAMWFAHGYFSYKDQLSKARSLKDEIASFDDQFERARQEFGSDSSKMEALYNKLQSVQAQFDSVKTKLELKDQRKIYSDTIEVFLDEIMGELNEKNYSIPQHMLERVKYYIDQFTGAKRRSTEILLQRRNVYFSEIEQIFAQKNVPVILAYVAMQESMLDTNIASGAGAVGMWQFMESTGRRFNLTIDQSNDERLNWKKSTMAAANYFRSLLLLFGDGRGALLAIAAYNAGEEKIKKALENVENPIRDRDFWYLYRTSSILANETREYVPQVLARIIIDRHPDLYGF